MDFQLDDVSYLVLHCYMLLSIEMYNKKYSDRELKNIINGMNINPDELRKCINKVCEVCLYKMEEEI